MNGRNLFYGPVFEGIVLIINHSAQMKLLYILPITAALIFSGCKKEHTINPDQKILFEVSYVNYAWVYVNQGYIIDNEGNILTFNNPENWHFPDNTHSLTSQQVEENLSKCIKTGKKVPLEELKKYSNYIDNLAASKISSPVSRGADMGAHGYYCFQYSPSGSTYKCVTLKVTGDWESENINFYTKKVVDWLSSINASR
jgi:hypothetical protein